MTTKDIVLNINKLTVNIEGKKLIQDLSLTLKNGEVHAIMGPNGGGKSTLANILARKPGFQIENGAIMYLNEDLLSFTPEMAATKGIFLGFQHPVAIPGVSNVQFLKTAVNALRQAQNLPPLDAVDFLKLVKTKMAALNMDEALLYRGLNEGFSGGEKKKNEILQMSLLEPKLAILDETDSGLDIDALKSVAEGCNHLKNNGTTIMLITHHQRFLDYIVPDYIHVLKGGTLVHSGDKHLGLALEKKGYTWLEEEETV